MCGPRLSLLAVAALSLLHSPDPYLTLPPLPPPPPQGLPAPLLLHLRAQHGGRRRATVSLRGMPVSRGLGWGGGGGGGDGGGLSTVRHACGQVEGRCAVPLCQHGVPSGQGKGQWRTSPVGGARFSIALGSDLCTLPSRRSYVHILPHVHPAPQMPTLPFPHSPPPPSPPPSPQLCILRGLPSRGA